MLAFFVLIHLCLEHLHMIGREYLSVTDSTENEPILKVI